MRVHAAQITGQVGQQHWTATLGTTTGQHLWSAQLTPLANSTVHHQWSAPLAGIISQDSLQHVPNTSMMMTMTTMMQMMMIMTMMMMMLMMMMLMMVMEMDGQHYWPALLTPLASSTGHHHWSAPMAGSIGQGSSQHVPNTPMTPRAAF